MSDSVTWRCSRPVGGLRDAMRRLAIEVMRQGEYDSVEILSTPKTTTGGRTAAIHFKVRLRGSDNGQRVTHEHRIKLEHRDASGRVWRYQKRDRPPSYDYSTLQAKNRPPSNCPKARREQREALQAAQAVEAVEAVEAAAVVQIRQDGWYEDPHAAQSGMTWRYFANGTWTDDTA